MRETSLASKAIESAENSKFVPTHRSWSARSASLRLARLRRSADGRGCAKRGERHTALSGNPDLSGWPLTLIVNSTRFVKNESAARAGREAPSSRLETVVMGHEEDGTKVVKGE